jgi:hypothetical protein
MAQEYKPGEIVPQSGIYTITHDPAHADMPHEVTGRQPSKGHPSSGGVPGPPQFRKLLPWLDRP